MASSMTGPKRLASSSVRSSTISSTISWFFFERIVAERCFSATLLRHCSRNARIADLAQATSPRSIAPPATASRC